MLWVVAVVFVELGSAGCCSVQRKKKKKKKNYGDLTPERKKRERAVKETYGEKNSFFRSGPSHW